MPHPVGQLDVKRAQTPALIIQFSREYIGKEQILTRQPQRD
jgi:hypothetical protein